MADDRSAGTSRKKCSALFVQKSERYELKITLPEPPRFEDALHPLRLGELLTRRAAGTVATRYKVLKILYRWLEEEDEIATNPMAKLRPPIVPEQPVPVVPEDGLRRLLATCAGKGFADRRDTALILLLVDVGPRRAELMGLKVADVDFDLDVLLVVGKGRRERALPFGRRSAVALDRYLRARARHKHAGLPWLWLGRKGRLTEWRLVQMLHRRGGQAGLPGLYPHQLRHTFAHQWLAEGGGETDLMRLAGWSPAQCSAAMAPRRLTPVPARPTAGCRSATGCSTGCIGLALVLIDVFEGCAQAKQVTRNLVRNRQVLPGRRLARKLGLAGPYAVRGRQEHEPRRHRHASSARAGAARDRQRGAA